MEKRKIECAKFGALRWFFEEIFIQRITSLIDSLKEKEEKRFFLKRNSLIDLDASNKN